MNIGNAMSLNRLLIFEEVFPDEEALKPEQYLAGSSKEMILKVSAFFLGFKSYNSKYKDYRELLSMLFGPENNDFANQIYERIKFLERTVGKTGIINSYTSLKLFEYFFAKPEEPGSQTSAEFERNVFKAYLVLNAEVINSQETAGFSTEKLEPSLRIPIWFFCMAYPMSDTNNYDIIEIWVTQLTKAIYLFEYLETSPKTKLLLDVFLTYFNSPDWQEYLKSLLPLTLPAIKNEREAHTDITVTKGENFEKGCDFIEKLIVNEFDALDENDFLSLRAKPFYKVENGVYRIIFNLFVVEKIFKGLYFLLRNANETLNQERQIPNFRSFYCYEFSERKLLYRIIDIIYPGKCIKFSGKEIADSHIDGAPDYYLRKGRDVLIFESKDFLIKAGIKASFDYHQYEKEFAKRLYYKTDSKGKVKPGAVLQLINFIRALLKNEFSKDRSYHYREISIYPILITHDHQYDTPGFNQMVNMWFQEELESLREEGLFTRRIKPLTVINIDSLIYYHVGLAEDVPLHEVIYAYLNHIKIKPPSSFQNLEEYKQQYLEKLISFSLFLNWHFNQLGIHKPPPIMDIVGNSLFHEVWKGKSQ